MATGQITPPPGFELEDPHAGITPPPGFELEKPKAALPPEPEKPGFFSRLGEDLKSAISLPRGVSPYPGTDLEGKQAIQEQSSEQNESEKKAGYGPGYRAAASIGSGIGVNVPGMEESARQGDVGGVLGHAAAVPSLMAAGELIGRGAPALAKSETAGKVARTVGAGAKPLGVTAENLPVVGSIVKGAKALPEAASTIKKIWQKPAPTFPGAPLPEHPGTFPGAHLPDEPGTFPGANLPANPAPEQLNPSILSKSRTMPGQIAPENVRQPAPKAAASIPPRQGTLALPSAPIGAELNEIPVSKTAQPAAKTGEALGTPKAANTIGKPAQPGPAAETIKPSVTKIADQVQEGLGGKKLVPNLPLRMQAGGPGARLAPPAAVSIEPEHMGQFARANGYDLHKSIPETERGDVLRAKIHNMTNVQVRQLAINAGEDMGQSRVGNRKGTDDLPRQDVLKRIMAKHSPDEIGAMIDQGKHLPSQ